MNKNIFSTVLLTVPLTLLATTPEKPNILLILVDDLGYGDLSCQMQNSDVQTPHIDKLLNEGIRFTNFHANCTVSSPSRAALLTGRYPDIVGVPGVIRQHAENSWGYLSKEAILLPQILKQQGYHTSIIGKWHLGLETPNTPNERGFDYSHGLLDGMMDDYYTHLRHDVNYMRKNGNVITPKGHATELFSDWAIQYVTKRKDERPPFFLYLAYNAPHTPIQPPTEWVDKVKEREPNITAKRAKFLALVEHLDHNIGRVYQALKENGQLENTLIIFTSDNGGQGGVGANNSPLRGVKGDMYEGGICVPAGFYWKEKIKPVVNNNFIMLFDLFPTLCDLIGIRTNHQIDGISLLPILQGKDQTTDDRLVYWMRREGDGYGGRAYYAARYKNFKLLQNTPWEPLKFYDLDADPQEQTPIMDKKSAEYKKLFVGMREHIRRSGQIPFQRTE